MINRDSIKKWFADNGDITHNLNHNLNKNSIVLDIGGYTGVWASQILEKYGCHIYILEPVPDFYEVLERRFSNCPNISTKMVGVSSDISKEINIDLDGDATLCLHNSPSGAIKIRLSPIEEILEDFEIQEIDLVQINIEGAEYSVLEEWLRSGTITRFKKLQIQFHEVGYADCIVERAKIQNKLSDLGYTKVFDYPFVWEAWEK
tara:strand:- start:776 stop:1387 length:612 start_codon:yes stop_codon:yes gene_type:complete